MMWKTI